MDLLYLLALMQAGEKAALQIFEPRGIQHLLSKEDNVNCQHHAGSFLVKYLAANESASMNLNGAPGVD